MNRREMSLWGWGYANKFPDDDGRRQIGAMFSALLGGADLSLRKPPRIEDVSLPEPRIRPPASLADCCSSTPFERATHAHGKNYRDLARGFVGHFVPAPDLVALPQNEMQVQSLLDWCSCERIAVIPYGGGTSVVGGIEAAVGDSFKGVVSLDLRALDRVLEVDPISRSARIQAGATGPAIEEQLGHHGLTLRHFPQSFEFSTLGGWIATRSGGHFATLYTHIDDSLESLRMLTPRGVLETRRLPASGAGPNPNNVALGSEGILGVITEAWVRAHSRPKWRIKANVRFRDFKAGVTATRLIAQAGLYPANCRLLDAREAMINGIAADGNCILLLGFESADHPLDAWMARALEIARAEGGEYSSEPAAGTREEAGHTWRQAFIEAPYLLNTLVSLGIVADTFETACTWDRFETLHNAVVREVRDAMKRVCGKGLLACRFSHVYPDGPAPYYTFIAPGRPGSEIEQWTEIKRVASDTLLAHGATITHHHAVGRVHRPWYDQERSTVFAAALQAAKGALDPEGVLNPGVLIGP